MGFWPKFSLRLLMVLVTVVAVLCAYVAHEAAVVRERQEWLDKHIQYVITKPYYEDSHGTAPICEHCIMARGDESRRPGIIRCWLGDSDRNLINVYDRRSNGWDAAALFPEATVFYWGAVDGSRKQN